ncbi:MAG TPA: SDR family oxidoreductase [bacterium]|nr:SDR family oxidoreductase [bacterium]
MIRPSFNLKGITALITGASFGLGEAFARELAAEGANLILVARSRERLEILGSELAKIHGIQTHIFETDLSFQEAPYRLFDSLQKAHLSVDLLVNNAGFGRAGYFEDANAEKDNEMLLVNVNSLVSLTHLLLPDMLVKGRGGIINVASTAAFQPLPFLSLYSATKAFVLHLTEALWAEYCQRGIRILCLCPGNTKTEFHARAGIRRKRIFLQADPRDVVRLGLRVFKTTDQPTAIFGFRNWLLAQSHRFLPRRCLLRIVRRFYRSKPR